MTTANPQSFNRYAYVQNDPSNLIDPTGLCLWVQFMDPVTERTWWEAFLCNDIPAGRGRGAPDGRGGGPGNARGNPQIQQQATDECERIKQQLEDPLNASALSDAWRRSQVGVKHEEGGLLGYTFQGSTVNNIFTPSGGETELTGFTTWAYRKKMQNKNSVTYMFWYHVHPHEQGEKVAGGEVGDPNFPTKDDRDVSKTLGLLGILVSRKHIVVFDKDGFIRCHFDR